VLKNITSGETMTGTLLEGKIRNRWMLAVCAVGIHLSIGSIYAWSQIAVSITKQFPNKWGLVQITLCFSISIVCLGIATIFFGHFVDRRGPKASGIIAACLFGAGLIGGGIAIHIESLYLLYATYGVLGGLGIGLGYITPVSTLLKWFPDRRGLANGLNYYGIWLWCSSRSLITSKFISCIWNYQYCNRINYSWYNIFYCYVLFQLRNLKVV
jgi:MFS transporter, OFA family, oxalate/formate antiporter